MSAKIRATRPAATRWLAGLSLVAVLAGLFSVFALASPAYADSIGISAANIAKSQVGTAESPDGSGCNKYTYQLFNVSDGCASGLGRKSSAYAWCSDFAMWVWEQAGASISGLTSESGSFYTYGVKHGTWHAAGSGYSPQPGDAVLYGLDTATANASHVGIVYSWPDVIQGNFSDNGVSHWQVRDDPSGVDTGVNISGWVSPVSASGAPSGGGSSPAMGTILGSRARAFYIGPNSATSQVGTIPNGTQIAVDCTVGGQATTGPYGTETTWDRTNYGGSVGFVSDAWVYTGTNDAAFPSCGGNAVAMEPGCLAIHEAPSNASTSDGCIPQATSLTIDCTSGGDANSGPLGVTSLWDHTNFNGETGYVTDAYMYTGTANAVAGGCPAIIPPQFGQSSIPALTVGKAFSAYLTVSAGAGPYSWSIVSGSLPAGLKLGSDGAVSGTPTKAGSYSVTIRVTDSESPAATAVRTFAGTVKPALAISTAVPSAGKVGVKYSAQLAASGGTPGYTWKIAAGSLPKGLTLSSAGKISGTPTVNDTAKFTVTVTDAVGARVWKAYSVAIAAGTLKAPTPTLTGTAKVADALTAHPGTWTAGTALSYQWYAAGKPIKGATKSTFTLTSSQVSKAVTVKVTGEKAGYTTITKISAATKKVAR
jgi:hypothetical protein